MPITLSKLLRRVDPKTEERVEGARRRANTAVRNLLRDRTRLSFSFDDEGQRRIRQVSVKLDAGRPSYIEEIEFDDDIVLLLELSKVRNLLDAGASEWSRYQKVNQLLEADQSIDLRPLDAALFADHHERFGHLLKVLDKRDPLQKILHLEDDILGEYAYGTDFYGEEGGEIYVYWGIIGLVSDLLGVHVEDLTVVVLAHELAHAYTHQGFEIDGTQWESSRFRSADQSVKEGLAQYFTHLFLTSKQDAFPGAFEVFERLLNKQADCYSAHIGWIEDHTPEHVRRAMLEARRSKEPVSKEKFEGMLKTAKSALSFG